MKIKEIRNSKGITQKQIASDLNIRQNTFSQYENGHREPDIMTLSRIADYLNTSIDDIVGKNKIPAAYDELSEKEKEVLNLFRGLSEEERDLLIAHGEFLKQLYK